MCQEGIFSAGICPLQIIGHYEKQNVHSSRHISLFETHLASFFCIFFTLDTREKNEKNKNKNLPVLLSSLICEWEHSGNK
jgi:hypothetical protein